MQTLLFVSIQVGPDRRPATLKEAVETSERLGTKKPYAEDIDPENGCFNLEVPRAMWTKLSTKGSIEAMVRLSSGLEAIVNAEMP